MQNQRPVHIPNQDEMVGACSKAVGDSRLCTQNVFVKPHLSYQTLSWLDAQTSLQLTAVPDLQQ